MLRHGGSQTRAVEGAYAPRMSRQERRGALELCNKFIERGNMDNSKSKHSILWWIGMFFLWLCFFPIMLFLFLLRTKKIPNSIRIPLLIAYSVLCIFSIVKGILIDESPPVIEINRISANYGSPIALKDLATISDVKDGNPIMIITHCDPKAGTISDDGQSVTFSKVGDFTVKVKGQDRSENVVEVEIPVTILDGTPPIIEAKKVELSVLDRISVSDVADVRDEVDTSPELLIEACDGNAEISKDKKSIVFKEPGNYTIDVMATDASKNENQEQCSVKIVNSIIPEIQLSEKSISIADTDSKVNFEQYVTSKSVVYGDLTKDVVIDSSAVQYGKPGKYDVKYSITDKDGNKNETTLPVTVNDTTPPDISTFITEFVLTVGDEKPDYLTGLTVQDSYEGDLTSEIHVDDSSVDYDKAATYTIQYTVTDRAGNTATKEATVTVNEKIVEKATPVVAEEVPVKEETFVLEEETTGGATYDVGISSEYILNTNTYVFHHPGCSAVNKMKDKNKQEFYGTRDEIIGMGYKSCGICNP